MPKRLERDFFPLHVQHFAKKNCVMHVYHKTLFSFKIQRQSFLPKSLFFDTIKAMNSMFQ